jgi:MoxR-like ATPase
MKAPNDSLASRKFEPNDVERHGEGSPEIGDQRGGALYVYSEKVKLAVRVALCTGRPLLVRGESGWGKSSLAGAIAKYKKWRYLEKVISSRTQARDLMSELDLVRRLSDAQGSRGVDPDWRRYIRPGVLWKAFDPVGAALQEGYFKRSVTDGRDIAAGDDAETGVPAVVLLDEMDKADPDVPNNLLVALGSLQFDVDEIGPPPVKAHPEALPLIVVTTNDERDLPGAFLRRCVEIELPALDGSDEEGNERRELLVKIGAEHLKDKLDLNFVKKIADIIINQPKSARADDNKLIVPSPAEFIDTLRAVRELYGTGATKSEVEAIIGIAVPKRDVSRGI